MKRQYECLYIIANDVTEAKRNELIEKFSKMAGESCKVEKWGLKKFATPINYKKDGYYVLLNFENEPEVPSRMGALMNITEGIVRYMFLEKSDNTTKKEKVKVKGKKV